MTVLVADDYAPLRESMRETLERAGYDVIEAEDGAQALQATERLGVDVLLLDLRMPLCDGYEVLRRLGRQRPVVIILSAFEQGESIVKVEAEFGSRVFAVLRKPVSPAMLCDTVRAALEESNQGVDQSTSTQ